MKKILVIRFSSIGDIVLTTPIVRCIKAQLNAEVHYITKDSYAHILENNPQVDKVYSIKSEITEVLESLKAESYDFVVDLHNNLRSVRLKKKLRRPSAAFPKLNTQKLLLTSLKWDVMPDVHVVDRYFKATQKLGVKPDGKGLDYFIPEAAEINPLEYNIIEPYIAFVIGAKYATKRLPNDKIIEIVEQIKLPVVLLGGAEDEENATIIRNAGDHVHSLVGLLSLDQSASFIKQATAVITHDTGLMHIAAAFNKKIISIWGNTVPALGMYPYMPENPDLFSIHEVDVKCRPCSKIGYDKCPKKHFKCMNNQDVAAIVNSI